MNHSRTEMGNFILGMPGPWADNFREAADHYTTKIGGLPDWPFPKIDIRPDLLKCGQCGGHLCLVSQLYAPISSDALKIEERIMYVFGCAMQQCGSNPLSWRALRVQKSNCKEETCAGEAEATSLAPVSNSQMLEVNSQTHGCEKEIDDVNDDDLDLEELGRALFEAATLASHSKDKKAHRKLESLGKGSPLRPVAAAIDTQIPVLPCFYIYPQEEVSSGDINAVCSNYSSLSIKEKENELNDHKEETWEEESYEYDRALYADRTYLKFKKRMDAYPEQCFRYWYGGKPLLATGESEVPENCQCCGADRHYEMQLMPPLLFFLRESNDDLSTYSPEWNWMTLIVYTCSKSCSQKPSSNNWTVAEETVVVQLE